MTRVVGAFAAVLVATVLIPTASAAAPRRVAIDDGLTVTSTATFRYDPTIPAVVVDTDMSFVNETAPVTRGNVVSSRYWNAYPVLAVKEATGFHADSGGRPLSVRTEPAGSDELVFAQVSFGRNLFYRDTFSMHVTYTIPATAPRSGGTTRVNTAYATFAVYAVGGDPGRSTVQVVVPASYEVDLDGDHLTRSRLGTEVVYRADHIDDPDTFFAGISVRDDDRLVTKDVGLHPEKIKVRAWPGDGQWADYVSTQVARGVPVLEGLVGLKWPDDDELDVVETVTPYLYGYAGWYLASRDAIEIGDALDQHVVLHELSHVWFNTDLFTTRWIVEGMAEEYSTVAGRMLGSHPPSSALPAAGAAGHQPLNTWSNPDLQSDASADEEHYGYAASYAVIDQLWKLLGQDRMQDVIKAAQRRWTAYPGDGSPEKQSRPADWERFLDLLDEQDHEHAAQIDALFRKVVIDPADQRLLDARGSARAGYDVVESEGGDWSPPLLLRRAMGNWEFADAQRMIITSRRILDRRAVLTTRLQSLDLHEPRRLETGYEGADRDLKGAQADVDEAIAVAGAIAHARKAVDDSSGPLAAIGRLFSSADGDLSDARTAYERGDLRGARASAHDAADAADAEASRGALLLAGLAVVVLVVAGGVGTAGVLHVR
ncbi:MAG: hypothetical protein JO291_15185, partial [Acidimicrobiia bacterium]|nr:hypothetical protein [Acidimicrobiia bacterium]